VKRRSGSCNFLGARGAIVCLLAVPWLPGCVETDSGRDVAGGGDAQARAEQSLYAEVAHALQSGIEPIAGAGGPDDGGGDGSDPMGGGTTGGSADDGAGGSDGAGTDPNPDPSAGDGNGDGGTAASCFGACGTQVGDCWCDDACGSNGDCCADYDAACPGPAGDGGDGTPPDTGTSCAGACGDVSPDGCWCDDECGVNGDCCDDYAQQCGAAVGLGPVSDLALAPPTQDASLSCLASWTGAGAVGGAATGVLVGEALSKSCEAGGVIVGVFTAGTGFAAATVCLAGDVTQADAALGGIVFGVLGAVRGLIAGIQECDDEQMQQAEQALGQVLESRSTTDRVFVAPISAGKSDAGTCNPCPPEPDEQPEPDRVDCVPPSIPHGECASHHVHVYAWKTEQNPQDCVCRYKADETYLCYDPVADPGFAANAIWERCL
jgi:hypothetical protein